MFFGQIDDYADGQDNDFNAFILGNNSKKEEEEIREAILSKNLLVLMRHAKLNEQICRFNIKANSDPTQKDKFKAELANANKNL